jgi:hypothetical protein
MQLVTVSASGFLKHVWTRGLVVNTFVTTEISHLDIDCNSPTAVAHHVLKEGMYHRCQLVYPMPNFLCFP